MIRVDSVADYLCEKHNRPLGRSLLSLSSLDVVALRHVTSAIAMDTNPTDRLWRIGGETNDRSR